MMIPSAPYKSPSARDGNNHVGLSRTRAGVLIFRLCIILNVCITFTVIATNPVLDDVPNLFWYQVVAIMLATVGIYGLFTGLGYFLHKHEKPAYIRHYILGVVGIVSLALGSHVYRALIWGL